MTLHNTNNPDCVWNYPGPVVKGSMCSCSGMKYEITVEVVQRYVVTSTVDEPHMATEEVASMRLDEIRAKGVLQSEQFQIATVVEKK